MTPPRSLALVGGGDFREIGREFKDYFVELAGLRPDEKVLDVGCGSGRMAVPLTEYLTAAGEYQGFDIVLKGVAWCRDRIGSRFANFHFQHVDVYNKNYNPRGTIPAREFTFPFRERYFDFVFLVSVFTHMLPVDMERYLSEISRVLKPGGRCLGTFFLLNAESRQLLKDGKSSLTFAYPVGSSLILDHNNPEAAISHEEEAVKELLARYGLVVVEPIRYGSWCGRSNFLTYQDVVLISKIL